MVGLPIGAAEMINVNKNFRNARSGVQAYGTVVFSLSKYIASLVSFFFCKIKKSVEQLKIWTVGIIQYSILLVN